jgi:hypothetical protein
MDDIIEMAFVAGFKASGEGYNGEYPFDEDERLIARELWEQISECREKITRLVMQEKLEAARSEREDTQQAQPATPSHGDHQ